LNTRITSTDADQRTYIDEQFALKKPLFYFHKLVSSSEQEVDGFSYTRITWTASRYNVEDKMKLSDGKQFISTNVLGYYQLNVTICIADITRISMIFYKNDVEHSRSDCFNSTETDPNGLYNETTITCSTIMYLNATDRFYVGVKVAVNTDGGRRRTIKDGADRSFISGHYIQS
jgi:hypothetical protein